MIPRGKLYPGNITSCVPTIVSNHVLSPGPDTETTTYLISKHFLRLKVKVISCVPIIFVHVTDELSAEAVQFSSTFDSSIVQLLAKLT